MERDVAIGSDGTRGSGFYWANWDGEVLSPNKKSENIRAEGAVGNAVQHSDEVFRRACEEGKTYP
jgi:hypothetical protein